MPNPNPQRYVFEGRRQAVSADILANAVATMARIRASDPRITVVFTLRHLAELTDLPYLFLRRSVGRKASLGYKTVYLRKHIPGRSTRRMINIPGKSLMHLQRWIVANVLQYTRPHPRSYAFHPGSSPAQAAQEHCGCKWLLKIDLEDFFHSVSEGMVQKVFHNLGYSKLLSFEMARLVTIPLDRGQATKPSALRWTTIPYYQYDYEGFLPQGAPTSPMLANLVMTDIDERLFDLALSNGLTYTRYADDLAFSTREDKTLAEVKTIQRKVFQILNEGGFRPNHRKSVIRGPGARRIVLGILVDTPETRLSAEFKDNLRLHLYYLTSPGHGPAAHAKARKSTISGIYHHVFGLINWAKTVEPDYAVVPLNIFNSIAWPPVRPSLDGFDLMDEL